MHSHDGSSFHDQGEALATQLVPELLDGLFYGQGFLFHDSILLLGGCELLTDVNNWVLLLLKLLSQKGSQAGLTGICMDQEGQVKVWFCKMG